MTRTWLGRLLRPTNSVESAGPRQSVPKGQFVPPGHFYSPIPDLADVNLRAATLFDTSATSIPGVDLNEVAQLKLLKEFEPYYAEQPFTSEPTPGRRYHFDNPMYSYSDALFLYCMLRHLRPRRMIEIGSGYSSAVTLDTNDLFLGRQLKCTFIEPYPEVLRSMLRPGDLTSTEVLPVPLQQVELERFRELKANDVLFVDSTHVSKIGSDVNRIFFEILPELAPGVHVHFHDIFFPFEYPRGWVEEGRAWNEAYLLRAFLQYNADFEIVLFNTFLEIHHRALIAQLLPLCLKNLGGSLWLRRK
jgi:Methyltransferase domain